MTTINPPIYAVVQGTITNWVDLGTLGRSPLIRGPYTILETGIVGLSAARTAQRRHKKGVDWRTVDISITTKPEDYDGSKYV